MVFKMSNSNAAPPNVYFQDKSLRGRRQESSRIVLRAKGKSARRKTFYTPREHGSISKCFCPTEVRGGKMTIAELPTGVLSALSLYLSQVMTLSNANMARRFPRWVPAVRCSLFKTLHLLFPRPCAFFALFLRSTIKEFTCPVERTFATSYTGTEEVGKNTFHPKCVLAFAWLFHRILKADWVMFFIQWLEYR